MQENDLLDSPLEITVQSMGRNADGGVGRVAVPLPYMPLNSGDRRTEITQQQAP